MRRTYLALMLLAIAAYGAKNKDKDPFEKWNEIFDDLTSTGPVAPKEFRPTRTADLSAQDVQRYQKLESVRRLNTARFGRPRWGGAVLAEYEKRGKVVAVPLRSTAEVSHTLLLFPRNAGGDPCVALLTTRSKEKLVTLSNARGEAFLRGKVTGKTLKFERAASGKLSAGSNCPVADDGIIDCTLDYDVPDILEPPCAAAFGICAAWIVLDCVGDHL